LREFDDLEEWSTDTAIDFTVPFATRLPGTDVWSGLPAKFQSGISYSYRKRDYALRRFQYESSNLEGLDTTLSPEDLLVPQNIGTYFTFTERTLASDSFDATQEIAAVYGQFDLPIIKDRLKLNVGGRLEYSYIFSRGAFDALVIPPEFEIPINDLDALPAVNLVYSPLQDMNIRFGFSQNVLRGPRDCGRRHIRGASP
jgi:outer membrane receptor protein involved in Fe transport